MLLYRHEHSTGTDHRSHVDAFRLFCRRCGHSFRGRFHACTPRGGLPDQKLGRHAASALLGQIKESDGAVGSPLGFAAGSALRASGNAVLDLQKYTGKKKQLVIS